VKSTFRRSFCSWCFSLRLGGLVGNLVGAGDGLHHDFYGIEKRWGKG